MTKTLVDVLGEVGAPFLGKVVANALPPPFDTLAGVALDEIGKRLGVAPTEEAIVARYEAQPAAVTAVIDELEANPEVILAGVEQQKQTNASLKAERDQGGPLWTWAWRPAGMWGLGFFWLWNLVLLHIANAVWKIALPPTDLWVLLQFSALYMGLYMGGHTVKDIVTKKWGRA